MHKHRSSTWFQCQEKGVYGDNWHTLVNIFCFSVCTHFGKFKQRDKHMLASYQCYGYCIAVIRASTASYPHISTVHIKYFHCIQNFQDRFAAQQSLPPIDPSQDWFLVKGMEEGGYTMIEFTRNWTTCDDKDRDISVSW